MKFHSGPRFGLTEEEQLTIYGICTSYKRLSPETQRIIDDAVQSCGGIYATALFEAITTRETVPSVAYRTYGTNCPIDPSGLAKRVKAVYKTLAKTLPVWQLANGDPPPFRDTIIGRGSLWAFSSSFLSPYPRRQTRRGFGFYMRGEPARGRPCATTKREEGKPWNRKRAQSLCWARNTRSTISTRRTTRR